MSLIKKIRTFSLSSNALRVCGMLFLIMGAAGSLIARKVLCLDGMSNSELFELMEKDPTAMTYSTMVMIFQVMEACAVPIFVFLLVEGATYTGSFRKYLCRVLGLAAVCEIPYNLLVSGSWLDMSGRNPVFAMVMCLLMLYFFRQYPGKKASHILIKATAILGVFLWSNILSISHGACCVILTAVLWALRGKQNLQTFLGIMTMVCCSVFSLYYLMGGISFLIIHFYSGERGYASKPVNYLSYPAILTVFGLISMIL